jgi:hypothetical protein
MFLQINKNSDNIRVLKIANTIKSILSDAFLKGKIKSIKAEYDANRTVEKIHDTVKSIVCSNNLNLCI